MAAHCTRRASTSTAGRCEGAIREEGARLPLLIYAPGWIENGGRVKGLANHIGILSTVLDLLGFDLEDE